MWVVNREGDELHHSHVGLLVLYRDGFEDICEGYFLDIPRLMHYHLPIYLVYLLEMTLEFQPQLHIQLIQLEVLELLFELG